MHKPLLLTAAWICSTLSVLPNRTISFSGWFPGTNWSFMEIGSTESYKILPSEHKANYLIYNDLKMLQTYLSN